MRSLNAFAMLLDSCRGFPVVWALSRKTAHAEILRDRNPIRLVRRGDGAVVAIPSCTLCASLTQAVLDFEQEEQGPHSGNSSDGWRTGQPMQWTQE